MAGAAPLERSVGGEECDEGVVAIDGPAAVLHPAGRCHANCIHARGMETFSIEFDPRWLGPAGAIPKLDRSLFRLGGETTLAARRLARLARGRTRTRTPAPAPADARLLLRRTRPTDTDDSNPLLQIKDDGTGTCRYVGYVTYGAGVGIEAHGVQTGLVQEQPVTGRERLGIGPAAADRARQCHPRYRSYRGGIMPAHSPRTRESFARARHWMVDRHIAGRGIRARNILEAMRDVPREAFLPPDLAPFAYDDRPLPIGEGQTISQPYVVAYMAEAAELRPGDRVLEVGTGSGYAAAILSRIAAEISVMTSA